MSDKKLNRDKRRKVKKLARAAAKEAQKKIDKGIIDIYEAAKNMHVEVKYVEPEPDNQTN